MEAYSAGLYRRSLDLQLVLGYTPLVTGLRHGSPGNRRVSSVPHEELGS
jgi:hypothetical protein